VGAISCAVVDYPDLGKIFGFLAITLATINVVGGFAVTDRMLGMFASKGSKKKGS
jgi:NAD(P) transhydrogenase subunit alpha